MPNVCRGCRIPWRSSLQLSFVSVHQLGTSETDDIFPFHTDTDECAENTDGCEQMCTDTDGSFECFCEDGFRLHSDERSCEGVFPLLNLLEFVHKFTVVSISCT